MSHGRAAYDEFCRIHCEVRQVELPYWCDLTQVDRMGWEAAAAAIVQTVTVDEAKFHAENKKLVDSAKSGWSKRQSRVRGDDGND